MSGKPTSLPAEVDILLIGGGIMSATVGTLLKALDPAFSIALVERLDDCGQESSQGWNNAGTGHAANCELNYTPQRPDGSIDITKALEVNVEFDLSRQLWAHLVRSGAIADPTAFIRACPHMSFVVGAHDVAFLKARHAALSAHHCFAGMAFSDDRATIGEWAPLVIAGRETDAPIAATRMPTGADVDYGTLTHLLVDHLARRDDVAVGYGLDVQTLERQADGRWQVTAKSDAGGTATVRARFVFIGAGGASLPLLQRAAIPEVHGYAGFPVSGVWLRCDNPEVVARHQVKVYGRAAHGSPPMSVPHLDLRVVDDRHSLLFGPYAGFSTRFLKQGSYLDLFKSLRPGNLAPLADVAAHSFKLEEYLVGQVVQSPLERFETLQAFYPDANADDWHEAVAGQRVQIIKPEGHGGTLEFGTQLLGAADHSIVGLLGASPGASTAASIAVSVVETCFADRLKGDAWQARMRDVIPTYGIDLRNDADACRRTRADTAPVLGLYDFSMGD